MADFIGIASLAKIPKISKPHEEGTAYHCKSIRVASSQSWNICDDVAVLLLGHINTLFHDSITLEEFTKEPERCIARFYHESGPGFVRDLDGYFLILLHDRIEDKLVILNNRFIGTNCYYSAKDGELLFANTMSRLLSALHEKMPLDQNNVPSFLNSGYSWSHNAYLQGISRLLPAYYLIWSGEGVEVHNYWRMTFDRKPIHDINKAVDEYDSIIRESIGNFLTTSGTERPGCLLSGGQDTSLVYLITAAKSGKPVHTFTASFESPIHDETHKAKQITELRENGVHHKVHVGKDALDHIPAMIRAAEEPCSGGSLGIYMCARAAARYCDVILTGDGNDILWGEYYPVVELHRYLKDLPVPIRRVLHGLAKTALKLADWERLWELEHVLGLFRRDNPYIDFFRHLTSYRHMNDEFRNDLFSDTFLDRTGLNTCIHEIPVRPDSFHDDLIETKFYYGHAYYSVPWTHKSIESFGAKFFQPYCTSRVIDFINALPMELLNRGNTLQRLTNRATTRFLHKRLLNRYIPAELIPTLQQSFDIPFHTFFSERPEVLDLLLVRLKRRAWFKEDRLERLFDEYRRQKVNPNELCQLSNHGYRIYSLLTLEVFCIEFVDEYRFEHPIEKIPLEEYLTGR
ncbi:asparagine synthase-related protein [Thermodesulfobacteriota bacterium]